MSTNKESTKTTDKIFDLLTGDDAVRHVYDRQKSIIKVAELVRGLRKDAGMSQKELAKEIGSKQGVISRLESYENDSMPNFETLILITHACGKKLHVKPNGNTARSRAFGSDRSSSMEGTVAF